MNQADYARESRDVACDVALCERMWYTVGLQVNNVSPRECGIAVGRSNSKTHPGGWLHSSIERQCNMGILYHFVPNGKTSSKIDPAATSSMEVAR